MDIDVDINVDIKEEYQEWDDDAYEEDAYEEDTYGDDAFEEEDDASQTSVCPECGHDVYEDAERCPHCQNYLSSDGYATARKPLWIIITAAICIYAMLHFYISALFFG